jgi:hypothetical protein
MKKNISKLFISSKKSKESLTIDAIFNKKEQFMSFSLSAIQVSAESGETLELDFSSIDFSQLQMRASALLSSSERTSSLERSEGAIQVVAYHSFSSNTSCSSPTYSESSLKCSHSHPNQDEVERITQKTLKEESSETAIHQIKTMMTVIENCATFFSNLSYPDDPIATQFAKRQEQSDRKILESLQNISGNRVADDSSSAK